MIPSSKTPPGNRLLFIKPSTYDRSGTLVRGKKGFFPSRTLPYLAALTPSRYDMRVIDDSVQEIPFDADVDLVALSGMLTNVPRAIDIARRFRRQGVTTVVGGIGAFSLGKHMEDSDAFDCVVYGEAETVWQRVLEDYSRGRLAPTYDGGRAESLAGLPVARYDLVDLGRYHKAPFQKRPFFTVETSRGCPHNCRFCGVSLFFGRKMRFRPIGEVVDEIRQLGARWIVITDDNVGAHPDRAIELFKALEPLKLRWAGQFAMDALKRPDMLQAAGRAGCRHAVVGVESLGEENLKSVDKRQNLSVEIEDAVQTFHDAGISFTASMILGLDHDTPETISQTTRRILDSGADFYLPWVLTLGPGSEIFDEFKAAGRLLHENYSLYNGTEVCFTPSRMTPDQLRKAAMDAMRQFYGFRNCLGRARRASHPVEVGALNLYFWHAVRHGRHPFTGAL
ncbi:MAG: B12-binding domain-containing radical SAM protein [Phycisphaerae bacterium]